MQVFRVAVLGCGNIFSRHLQAIKANAENFQLVGVFDTDVDKMHKIAKELNVKTYAAEKDVYLDSTINCIVILTPNNLHYSQILSAIYNHKNVIVEKPAVFTIKELEFLEQESYKYAVKIFTILQVRLTPSVIATKKFLDQGFFGKIRGASFIQRWQRPIDYFNGWRGKMEMGGGILREFSIHYLDVLQLLIGLPHSVVATKFYCTKFIQTKIDDSINVLLDYKDYGAVLDVSIAAEPSNLECSITLFSDMGCIVLGGKALDEIKMAKFNDSKLNETLENLLSQEVTNCFKMQADVGASPHHPALYKQLIMDPKKFELMQTANVIKLIEQIYTIK